MAEENTRMVNSMVSFSEGTDAEWLTVPKPIPCGMILHVTDLDILKKGDGVTMYVDLPAWQKIKAEDEVEVGQIVIWPRELKKKGVEPKGRLLYCDGSKLNPDTYVELFDSIQYTYGGSGNQFKLPKINDWGYRKHTYFMKY